MVEYRRNMRKRRNGKSLVGETAFDSFSKTCFISLCGVEGKDSPNRGDSLSKGPWNL